MRKSLYKESTFSYSDYSHVYQDLDHIGLYTVKNPGENSKGGKCGIYCAFCTKENSCLKCRNDGNYAIASNSRDRNNKNYLFCDLVQNFPSDQFELQNDIYYPIFNRNGTKEKEIEFLEPTEKFNDINESHEIPTEIIDNTDIPTKISESNEIHTKINGNVEENSKIHSDNSLQPNLMGCSNNLVNFHILIFILYLIA